MLRKILFFIDFDRGIKAYRQMPTIGSKLDSFNGYGPGFDFCRVYLAMSVLAWHSWMLVVGQKMLSDYVEIPGLLLLHNSTLPMFFALSGFLIAGSAQRLSCRNFLINRSLRIFPALAVEVTLSALVLGAILTSLPLRDYFTDPQTYTYFFNIAGLIQYFLPGVFKNNPFDTVNGSLWTVPAEFACYYLMTIVILTKAVNKAGWLFALATAYPFIWLVYMLSFYDPGDTGVSSYFLFMFLNFSGVGLIPCFLTGVAIYAARYRIPHSRSLFGAALVILTVMGLAVDSEYMNAPGVNIIINPLFAYVVIYLGLCRLPKLPFYSRGDYSYGIYLYAYPIQQTLIHIWPQITVAVHLVLSAVAVSAFAAFSWHFIEKPILGLRKNFSFVARRKIV